MFCINRLSKKKAMRKNLFVCIDKNSFILDFPSISFVKPKFTELPDIVRRLSQLGTELARESSCRYYEILLSKGWLRKIRAETPAKIVSHSLFPKLR